MPACSVAVTLPEMPVTTPAADFAVVDVVVEVDVDVVDGWVVEAAVDVGWAVWVAVEALEDLPQPPPTSATTASTLDKQAVLQCLMWPVSQRS